MKNPGQKYGTPPSLVIHVAFIAPPLKPQGLHAPKLRRANRAFCQVDIKDANNLAEEGQVWNVPIHDVAFRPGNPCGFKQLRHRQVFMR
jgi:hypothetical protein